MLFYSLSVFSITMFGLSLAKELSTTTCKRNLADYSVCLKHSLEEVWPLFLTGIPEFEFPSLDPLLYEHGNAAFNSGEINANIFLLNTSGFGLSKAQFFDVRTHFLNDVFRLEIDGFVPELVLKGSVKLNGTLSVFRVASEGFFNVTAYDVRGTWNIIGHVVNDTWNVEHFRTLPLIKKFKVHFDTVKGNKEINDLVTAFVNEFWPSLIRVMLPPMSQAWDPWLTGIINKFFSKVSFSKLFP
ncbi:uncharacterized protein LOC105834948 [Monomorium pharaonis]|uniref:uncharacterized protein LOC105834948 n=1 Tax=Monomorium pharaonis TaxID=307658 RepID=UPI00063FC717|nr:uncharacterized protein LOC105834948 [Monomorium pharaonis]